MAFNIFFFFYTPINYATRKIQYKYSVIANESVEKP